jgi:hypothetical protein
VDRLNSPHIAAIAEPEDIASNSCYTHRLKAITSLP